MREYSERVLAAALVGGALAGAGLLAIGLVVVQNPLGPWLLIGAAIGASAALYLANRPLVATHATLVLMLVPIALRIEPFHTIALNGCLAMALGVWILRRATQPEQAPWATTGIAAILLIAWASISLLWTQNLVAGRQQLVSWIIAVALLLLLVDLTRSRAALDRLMRLMRYYGWLLVLAGLATVLFTGYAFDTRLSVLKMNENGYGLFLIVMLPGVMWPALSTTGSRRILPLLASMIYISCSLPLIALTGSRGSALSLILMLLLFLAPRSTRPWGILGLCLLGGMALVAPFLLDVIAQRFEQGGRVEMGDRGPIWVASLKMILDRPWTGAGIGNGPLELRSYLASVTGEFAKRIDLPSHQPLLEVAADLGLVGVALYTTVILTAAGTFIRCWRQTTAFSTLPPGYYPVVAAMTAGFLVSWVKAGGATHNVTLVLVLTLLLIPGQLQRARRGSSLLPERSPGTVSERTARCH